LCRKMGLGCVAVATEAAMMVKLALLVELVINEMVTTTGWR
jgi:hypothetical protein